MSAAHEDHEDDSHGQGRWELYFAIASGVTYIAGLIAEFGFGAPEPLVLGLYWERANAAGALSAMIVGGVLYAVLATLKVQFLGFHPIVPALLLSLLAVVAGNRFGRPAPQSPILTTDK